MINKFNFTINNRKIGTIECWDIDDKYDNKDLIWQGTNSTRPLVITSEIQDEPVILPKALVLQDKCFVKNYLSLFS